MYVSSTETIVLANIGHNEAKNRFLVLEMANTAAAVANVPKIISGSPKGENRLAIKQPIITPAP